MKIFIEFYIRYILRDIAPEQDLPDLNLWVVISRSVNGIAICPMTKTEMKFDMCQKKYSNLKE